MSAGSSPKVGWKWKWSNGVGKSEMSIIWCISITNNVKSNKKNHWNSSNGQIHWFPIDFLWKWSIMDQNYANANAFFSDWNIFLRYPGYTIWKLTSRAFWKCGSFCCYNFLNPSYGWPKLGQILKKKSCRVKPYKKITRLQFCVLGSAIESASKHT